jgi:hypothetical protein
MPTSVFDQGSPILEKHVDFLLEEEFICNPVFLPFFINLAKAQAEKSLADSSDREACNAIRSVTDDSGETDVQVIYADSSNERTAILIEDKIRAGFQPTQQERYRNRGENGKAAGKWTAYWTCLLAPQGYGSGNHGFDARVSIEELKEFFKGNTPREKFRLGVLEGALRHFENKSVQHESPILTQFRSDYAQASESFFKETHIQWPLPRTAWANDTWFRFTSPNLPKGVYFTHKAPEGHVDMSFPNTNVDILKSALAQVKETGDIVCARTSKSASLQIITPKLIFNEGFNSQCVSVEEAFSAVLRLEHLWQNKLAAIASYDRSGLSLQK